MTKRIPIGKTFTFDKTFIYFKIKLEIIFSTKSFNKTF
jgi:hypothetical protein